MERDWIGEEEEVECMMKPVMKVTMREDLSLGKKDGEGTGETG